MLNLRGASQPGEGGGGEAEPVDPSRAARGVEVLVSAVSR
eukprot:COSAG02_NODE_1490_length_12364_cov_67.758418_1_plen_40_part_00